MKILNELADCLGLTCIRADKLSVFVYVGQWLKIIAICLRLSACVCGKFIIYHYSKPIFPPVRVFLCASVANL